MPPFPVASARESISIYSPIRPIHPPPPPPLTSPTCSLSQPSKDSDRFAELVTFMSHVAPCYKKETKEFGPQLKALLEQHGPVLVSGKAGEEDSRGQRATLCLRLI